MKAGTRARVILKDKTNRGNNNFIGISFPTRL